MEMYSFGIQVGAQLQDAGAQTDTESVDSGIQVTSFKWPDFIAMQCL
jgi:hypothetical protein